MTQSEKVWDIERTICRRVMWIRFTRRCRRLVPVALLMVAGVVAIWAITTVIVWVVS